MLSHSQNAMGCEHVRKQFLVHREGLLIALPRPLHEAHCEREGGGPTNNKGFGPDYSLNDGEGFLKPVLEPPTI